MRYGPKTATSAFGIKNKIDSIMPAKTLEEVSHNIIEYEGLINEWQMHREAMRQGGESELNTAHDPIDKKIGLLELCPEAGASSQGSQVEMAHSRDGCPTCV